MMNHMGILLAAKQEDGFFTGCSVLSSLDLSLICNASCDEKYLYNISMEV